MHKINKIIVIVICLASTYLLLNFNKNLNASSRDKPPYLFESNLVTDDDPSLIEITRRFLEDEQNNQNDIANYANILESKKSGLISGTLTLRTPENYDYDPASYRDDAIADLNVCLAAVGNHMFAQDPVAQKKIRSMYTDDV